MDSKSDRILQFKARIEIEPEFCQELFRHATIRLLAHKYAYYQMGKIFVDDLSYDVEEECWYIMGIALGILKEDETSPCVDFDFSHPLANEGIKLAKSLKPR